MAAVKLYTIQMLLIAAVSAVYGVTTPPPQDNVRKLLEGLFRSQTLAPYDDPCSRLVCFNGATCYSFAEDVWCDCLPGYYGTQCLETVFDKNYDWKLSSQSLITDWHTFPAAPTLPDLHVWEHVDTVVSANNSDYSDDITVGWIAPTIVIGIVNLGTICAIVIGLLQRRHRRRHILVRTVQVCASGAPTHPTPSSLIQGMPQGPYWGTTRVFPPRIHQGVTIPAEFVSDDTNLVATDSLAAEATDHTSSSSSVPTVITHGAPPLYAEFSPTEVGQSVDEPPPPYPGP